MQSIIKKLALLALVAPHLAVSAAESETTPDAAAETEVTAEPVTDARLGELATMCFIPGAPPSDFKYTVVRKLKVAKGSYGPVTSILPRLADKARAYGADAVINYNAAQRFGFWPWRITRPVARGTAIKWAEGSPPRDCTASGGATLQKIMETNREPGGSAEK